MSGSPAPLPPEPPARGLASHDPRDVARLVQDAWDGAVSLAGATDLDRPSRLPGWTARDVLVHLGSWPEHPRFDRLVDDVRAGRASGPEDVDARNARVVAAHRAAGAAEVAAGLERARDRALAFLTGPDAAVLGRRTADSPVGPLPLTGVIAAGVYDLAVHALDVAPGAEVPAALLDAGVGALVDTTGALAARSGVPARFAVLTPSGSWACTVTEDGSWTTARVDAPDGAALEGDAADVLDASAGRRAAVPLVLARRLRLHDVPGLLALLPALEAVPGLPGGAALRTAARGLGRTGRALGRLGTALGR